LSYRPVETGFQNRRELPKFITDGVLSRTLAADAGEQNRDAGFARRDFPKRRGFFFQGEANEITAVVFSEVVL
jgi:hypothetical protein